MSIYTLPEELHNTLYLLELNSDYEEVGDIILQIIQENLQKEQ